MALLVIGLVAAGIGTMAFLRNTLLASLDDQIVQLTTSDVAVNSLIETTVSGGEATFARKPDAVTDYSVAIYGPTGQRIITAGGDAEGPQPDFPTSLTLQYTQERGTTPFDVPSDEGTGIFRASADVYQPDGANSLYSQVVALPIAPINQVVTSFLGIYGILALITIVAGALLTRWLVTLTFRSLGQVESTAMTIAAGDFGQRMTDIEPMTTEVGRLKTALNTMLGRVDAAISQRDATVRQMRRFIGDASHELRTPLVTVRGYAELYRMGAITGDDDVQLAMDRIEKEAIRMGLLVEDLLALARLDERRDVVIAPVDLRPIARDAALDVRAASPLRPVTVIDTTVPRSAPAPAPPAAPEPEARRRTASGTSAIARAGGGALSLLRRKPRPVSASDATGGDMPRLTPVDVDQQDQTALAGATVPIVRGDENRIRQVVANLLGNARRFTNEESPIELRVGIDPMARMGWIEVVDHGEGIPDPIKEKIFQRFWRADSSRARETGGTGLGLAIVSSIIEALHGSVDVVDTPGGGATFRVAFPLAEERDAAEHLYVETQPIERLASAPE